MRKLSKRLEDVFRNAKPIDQWLEQFRYETANEITRATGTKLDGWMVFAWVATVVIGLLIGISALGSMDVIRDQYGEVTSETFNAVTFAPWWSWLRWMLYGAGASATILSVLVARLTNIKRKLATPRIENERRGHPLAARAELITRALRDYRFHLDRYRALREQVEDELVEPDPALEERYRAFLERAHSVLSQAVQNFNAVAERVKRDETYAHSHPEFDEASKGTGLSLLLDELAVRVEKPDLPDRIVDPVKALEHEEQIARIAAELDQQTLTTS